MQSPIDDSILARIKKLYDKAESLNKLGHEAEAMSFMAGVQKMLFKYNLSMSDVEYAAHVRSDPVKMHSFRPGAFGLPDKKRRIMWEEVLAKAVARAHHCDVLPIEKTNTLFLIGRRSNRLVAEYMLVILTTAVLKQSDAAYAKFFYECQSKGNVRYARGYRASYIEGFVTRIVARYAKEREDQLTELSQQERGVAMVRLNTEQTALVNFLDELSKAGATKDSVTKPYSKEDAHAVGFLHGLRDGTKVPIRQTGVADGSKPRQIKKPLAQLRESN